MDIERARRYGLAPGEVLGRRASLVSGSKWQSVRSTEGVRVVVYGTPETRHSLTGLQDLLIDTPSGGHVALKDLATVRIVPTATEIHRDAVARRMDVAINVRGRDLAAVAADVEKGIQQVDFPLEYRAELLGEYAVRQAAQRRVMVFAIAAAIGILLLLQAFFRSWSLATLVFLVCLLRLTGCVLAALAAGGGIVSLGSIVGFIAYSA